MQRAERDLEELANTLQLVGPEVTWLNTKVQDILQATAHSPHGSHTFDSPQSACPMCIWTNSDDLQLIYNVFSFSFLIFFLRLICSMYSLRGAQSAVFSL